MPSEQYICDFDNIADKRAIIARLGVLRGRWRVELTQ